MGKIRTIRVMRQLIKEWSLPDEMAVKWDVENRDEVTHAKKKFLQYLADGWMAFSEEAQGRRQIFKFNPKLNRIVLLPPLGGG